MKNTEVKNIGLKRVVEIYEGIKLSDIIEQYDSLMKEQKHCTEEYKYIETMCYCMSSFYLNEETQEWLDFTIYNSKSYEDDYKLEFYQLSQMHIQYYHAERLCKEHLNQKMQRKSA
ncbi:hypothetical protein N9562_00320 [Flavobacteriaceae bacterium]|nr:hypothetical protein [Flavobacteriaceae bacterium]